MRKTIRLALYALLCSFMVVSCKYFGSSDPPDNEDYGYSDSTSTVAIVDNYLNPAFGSAQDIVDYRKHLLMEKTVDSIFFSIPDEVMMTVARLVIKQHGYVDVDRLVEEYFKNQMIFDNLDIPKIDNEAPAPPEKIQTDSVEESSYIDTINGKPTKVTVIKRWSNE